MYPSVTWRRSRNERLKKQYQYGNPVPLNMARIQKRKLVETQTPKITIIAFAFGFYSAEIEKTRNQLKVIVWTTF